MKPVRFRVEFSPVLGYTHNPLLKAGSRASAKNSTPFAATLVLVQEKGALSTFKHIYQRLRAEWQLEALSSPDMSGGATPLIAATPKLK